MLRTFVMALLAVAMSVKRQRGCNFGPEPNITFGRCVRCSPSVDNRPYSDRRMQFVRCQEENGPQRFGEATGQGQIPNFQQL